MARARIRKKARTLLKMNRLKPEIRKEIETAQERNAKDMARLAQQWAPESRGGGDLKRSIRAELAESLRDRMQTVWRVVAGDEKAFYARFVEFGTAAGRRGERVARSGGGTRQVQRTHPGTPAQPYFYVAYRALRKRMARRYREGFRKAKKRALS